MSSKFEKTELAMPDIEYTFYDQQGVYLPENDKNAVYYHETRDGNNQDLAKRAELYSSLEIAKPNWFLEAEKLSQSFYGSLCFEDPVPTILIKDNKDTLGSIGFEQGEKGRLASAVTDQHFPVIIVRKKAAQEYLKYGGTAQVAKVIMHERAHATIQEKKLTYQLAGKSAFARYRLGWALKGKHNKGSFLEEGTCEWLADWGKRCLDKPLSPTIAIAGKPSPDLPERYQPLYDYGVSGPDGYAVELLAWGTERKRILDRGAFVTNLLDMRRPETKAVALRENIQAIEELQLGLYPKLRNLEYSRTNWQLGYRLVYEAVTARL